MRKFLHSFPLHTFLFIFFISLFLYAQNVDHVKAYMMTRTIITGSILAALIFGVFYLFTRHLIKSGIISTLILLVLVNYGVMYDIIEFFYYQDIWPFKNIHRYLILFTFLLSAFFVWLVKRKIKEGTRINYFLNVLIIMLIVFNSIRIISGNRSPLPLVETITPEKKSNLPNLYYIILDGYANHHTLKKYYGYDNSDFISFLEQKGFYIADSATSNFYTTVSSLASTFKMEYRDTDSGYTVPDLRNNNLFRLLKSKGYTLYNLQSGYSITSGFPLIDSTITINSPNEFERSILKFTIFRLDDLFGTIQYSRLKSQFEQLKVIPELSGSQRFMFIHIVAPHPPFVFNENGEQTFNNKNHDNHWEPKEHYISQLKYVNKQIKAFVSNLIIKDKNTVILLQSDHGPWIQSDDPSEVFEARSLILNAVRYPDHNYNGLYKKISSINTFRYFSKRYLDSATTLLPDRAVGQAEIKNSILFKERGRH